MTSAIVELIIFSVPSFIYARRLARSGVPAGLPRAAVGLRLGAPSAYALAVAAVVPLAALAALALHAVPADVLHGHSKNVVGAPTTGGGYLALVLLALAEEMFFRGWLATVLFGRLGFKVGNAIQALLFLAPHLLLLLVSVALWPVLPLQLLSGWVLGWLRERSGSIGPCWLAHALSNLLSAVLLGL